jgi:ribose transport system substrate-binding protein
MGTRRNRTVLVATVLGMLVVVALTLSACGSSSSSSSTSEGSSSGAGENVSTESAEGGAGSTSKEAEEQLEAAYDGRFTEPPSKPNPAESGKDVWWISPGLASGNAAAFAAAGEEAAKELGWKFTVYDAKLDPSKYSAGIREAVSAGADGIITSSIDCDQAKSAYEVAKKANVPVIGHEDLDCNVTEPGAEPLFAAEISLGNRYKSWPEAYEKWGSDLAAWTIVENEGEANVMNMSNEEFQLIKDLGDGFASRVEECPNCKLTDVPWTVSEVGGKLAATVQAGILKEPEVDAIQDAANPGLGISQGVIQAGKASSIDVVGGLGLPEDVAQLKEEGKGLNAMAAWPITWWSWAAVDTLNSVFNGNKPEDSGLGWQMVDRQHNLPAGDEYEPGVEYKKIYLKRWGK